MGGQHSQFRTNALWLAFANLYWVASLSARRDHEHHPLSIGRSAFLLRTQQKGGPVPTRAFEIIVSHTATWCRSATDGHQAHAHNGIARSSLTHKYCVTAHRTVSTVCYSAEFARVNEGSNERPFFHIASITTANRLATAVRALA